MMPVLGGAPPFAATDDDDVPTVPAAASDLSGTDTSPEQIPSGSDVNPAEAKILGPA
jgi:hypothetical protein